MDQLIQLIYVSSAVELFTQQQLNNLLSLARDENKKHEITGLLLYKDGDFMQVIEGKETDIDQLFDNIIRDKTHSGVIRLLKEPIEQRNFSNWSMGFKNLSSEYIDGFSDFLSATPEDTLLPGKAKVMLLSFKNI